MGHNKKLALGNPPSEAQSRSATMDLNKRVANAGLTGQKPSTLDGAVR